MKKSLLFLLIIFALIFVYLIISLNINTTDTIKYDNIIINIKHPVAYTLKKQPVLIQPKTRQLYNLELIDYHYHLNIILIKNDKSSPKQVIMDLSNTSKIRNMIYYSSNKSESDIIAEFKFKRCDAYQFFRIIKNGDYTIQMNVTSRIPIQTYMMYFDNMRYKREVEIMKNIEIKVIDEKKGNL